MESSGGQMSCRRVEVVYYLSRGGQLEHPHLIQLSLPASSQGLYLRNVKERLNAIRGKGMPASFSWSYKRIYKNGYVWQDLSDDDLIFPVNGCEYVLKGSEILVATDPFHNTVGDNGDHKLEEQWSSSGLNYRKSRCGGISKRLNLVNSCSDAAPPMTPPSSSPFLLQGSIVSPPPSSPSLIGEGPPPLALSSSSSGETVMAFQDDQFNDDNHHPSILMQISSSATAAAAYASDWGNNGVDVAIQTEVEEESGLNKSSSPVKNERSNIGTSTSDHDFFDGCPPPVHPCPPRMSARSPSTASMVCSSDHEYPSFGHYARNEHHRCSRYHKQDYLHHTHELSSSPLPSEGSFRKAMVKMNFAKKTGSPSSSASSFVSSISTIGASKNGGVSSSTKLHFAPCGRSGLDVREEVFLMKKRRGSNNNSNNNNSVQQAKLSEQNPMGPHNHLQDAVNIKCHSSLSERSLGDTDLGALQGSRHREDQSDEANRESKSITSGSMDRTRRSSVASSATNYGSSSSCHQQEQQTRQKSVSYYESVGLFLEEFLMRRNRSSSCKLDRRLSSSRCSSVRKEAWKIFTHNS